jgi:hypothetical protein
MGQFKPMIKMETTEPSVELKLKKGGHVSMKKKSEHGHKSMEHHMDGGMTGMMMPRGVAPAMAGMAPKRPAMAMRRKAMATPLMKKGGETPKEHKAEMKEMHKIEKELKHHESMKAGKAHKGLKAGGEALAKKMDKFETMTTIENDEKPYEKTEMHTAKKDKAHGTGAVREGNAGGYKKGGHIAHKARGGSMGDEETYGNYDITEVHQAKRDTAHGTGGVSMSNAGGYKKGGKAHHKYAHGGGVEKFAVGNVEGTPKGKTHTKTGEVKESNAGGYKKGGALKKHFATGGSVNNSGHAVVMPQANKPASKPVHINQLSGTFKRGGKVHKHADGGSTTEDLSKGAYDKTLQGVYNEDMDTAKYLRNLPSKIYQGAKHLMGMGEIKPAGSVTKSKESVTVTPAKKRGGSVKHR